MGRSFRFACRPSRRRLFGVFFWVPCSLLLSPFAFYCYALFPRPLPLTNESGGASSVLLTRTVADCGYSGQGRLPFVFPQRRGSSCNPHSLGTGSDRLNSTPLADPQQLTMDAALGRFGSPMSER